MFLFAIVGCLLGKDAPCTRCLLEDPHQYRYEADLDAEVVTVAAGQDIALSWPTLTQDVHGHPRDIATDIDEAWLVGFRNLDPEGVLDRLSTDTLSQSDIALFQTCTPERGPTCNLSEFGLGGRTLDVVFVDPESLWLVVLQSPLEVGGVSFILFQPDKQSDVTSIGLDDSTSSLEVEVDLHSAEALHVVKDAPALVLDWSRVSRDGLGNPFYPPALDSLFLGHFEESPAELEGEVFDLRARAASFWSMPLAGGMEADLSALQGETPFEGVTEGGTWLVALGCGTCTHPAPALVSVLEPA